MPDYEKFWNHKELFSNLFEVSKKVGKLYFAIDRKIYKSQTKEKSTELLILC